jgi:hypothetical protein
MWIYAFFFIGDEFNGLFSCGLRTMRPSSLHEFTESWRLKAAVCGVRGGFLSHLSETSQSLLP